MVYKQSCGKINSIAHSTAVKVLYNERRPPNNTINALLWLCHDDKHTHTHTHTHVTHSSDVSAVDRKRSGVQHERTSVPSETRALTLALMRMESSLALKTRE